MATKIDSPSSRSVSSCPWGTKVAAEVRPFTDVLDEEYARQLENAETVTVEEPFLQTGEDLTMADMTLAETDTSNDLLLAQMLQLEFNHENDDYVKSLEKNYNGRSKVSMSFKNFRTLHPYENESVDNKEHFADWDSEEDSDADFEESSSDSRKPTGKVKPGVEIITKHDSLISERRNAKNVELFPLNFHSGDVGKEDIRLPNHVYNKLKTHSKKEERNVMRIHEKQEHSTHEKALDENTRLLIYKMVNNGILETISGIVSTGKEAVVIHAKGGESEEGALPSEIALKVFKTTLSEFKTREKYIKDDHRFKDRFAKQNPRKIIRLWAEKEFRNLNRMQETGINCPRVISLRKHILVMTFIGSNQIPAPKLKDAKLSKRQLEDAYEQCTQGMKLLYEKCNLIHADLSEYNILWHNSKCFFIDVSQSVEPIHPHAFHFLLRDCQNIIRFFTKAGVSAVMKEDELFTYVCGKELQISNLDKIENECKSQFEKNEELLTHGIDSKNYSFDYHFEQYRESQVKELDKPDDPDKDFTE